MVEHEGGNSERKCCGIVQHAAARSKEKGHARRQKAQPWILLKLMVVITFGIIVYTFYVYIGRFCVPMIKSNNGVLGGRNIGIPFLIVFCLLGIMILWTYAMVVFVGPGKARDYVKPEPPPPFRNPTPRWWDTESGIGGAPYEAVHVPPTAPGGAHQNGGGLPQANGASEAAGTVPSAHLSAEPPKQRNLHNGVTGASPSVAVADKGADNVPPVTQSVDPEAPSLPPMMFTRKPSTTPVLLPEFRYCMKDGFVKPPRAHHCRACGTCILRYDHHCPWIGQCVGAHNNKFFINFLQWAALFCMWTFSTLLAGLIETKHQPGGDVDPQHIVIIALSAMFILFTVPLLFMQTKLIILNQTTVESLYAQGMKQREQGVLGRLHAFYEFGARRRTREQWDKEWGAIDTEGNLWWLGSARENWESVMGHSILGWFLPIGRSPGNGLSFPTNPRFDEEGRWRPRRTWPKELQ